MSQRPFPQVARTTPPVDPRPTVPGLAVVRVVGVVFVLGWVTWMGWWWRTSAPAPRAQVVTGATMPPLEVRLPAVETAVLMALWTPTPVPTAAPTATATEWPTPIMPPSALDLYGACHPGQAPGSLCVPVPPTAPPVPPTTIPECQSGMYPSVCRWPGTPAPTMEGTP